MCCRWGGRTAARSITWSLAPCPLIASSRARGRGRVRSHGASFGLRCVRRGEFDRVVVGDVSERAYRAPSHGDALDALAGKLGITCSFDGTDAVRRRFARAVGAARDRVVCVFPLRDAAGDAAYPAFFIDEFVASLPVSMRPRLTRAIIWACPPIVSRALLASARTTWRAASALLASPRSVETFPVARRGRLSTAMCCGDENG